ncbi:unnamed protein product [Penicillium roqueforti FM164]|uniref:Genomic scaffold, ProqFM164S02 n=1 Tax=Penicillium roqueforti (strain FM164) TaxID=1365484 RepID=W6Q7T6_PENRF|nr:unnamed protein product [Penicillium roqueforti FM164]
MGVINSVGASICQERLAQTTLKKWTEDPYFLYHLLALTQLQERKLHLSKPKIYTKSPIQALSYLRRPTRRRAYGAQSLTLPRPLQSVR